MRKRVRVPDDEVDPDLRASRKWAAKQDPAVLREKNRISKQRIRALKKVGLDAFDASKRASPGPGLSYSVDICESMHPTAIDPVLTESSPIRHQTVGCCDEPSTHSSDHSLSESGIPDAICDDVANASSMSARTVSNPAYIHDPSVTVDALDGATFPAPGHDEAICRGMAEEVSDLDDLPSVRENADLTDLVTDYAKFFDNPEVIQMKDSTRMCAPTLSRNGCNLLEKDAAAVRALSRYEIVTESTSRVVVITEFSSNEELAAKVRCEFSHGRYVYIPGGSMDSIRKDEKSLDMSYLQEFKIWSRQLVQCIDYEQRFSNPKAQHIFTTIRDFLNAIDDPKVLQVVLDLPLNQSLPCGLTGLNDGDNVFGVVKHSYPRSALIHTGQRYHRSWSLLHHAGVLTDAHHDAEGHSIAIVGQKGIKFWSILTLKPQYRSLPRTELLDKLADINQPDQQGTSNYIQLCDIETVKLRPGDILLQPPGSFYRVYTPIPSFATGAAFFVYEALHWTEISRHVDAQYHESVTDIEHDDPSGYQTLLQMLLAMQAMGSRLFYKRALSAHCLMILAPEDYVYQGRSLQRDFDGNEERLTYCTKKNRLEEIRSLLHYERVIEYADQIRHFLGFQTRDSLRSYVHNFKGDGPDEPVSIASINPPVSSTSHP